MASRIYLDNHATTRTDPRVVDAMLPYFTEQYGNANSPHLFGWEADEAVEAARIQVAELVGVEPKEVIFTSGATESDNLALRGVFDEAGGQGHVVTSRIEHPAVGQVVEDLRRRGASVTLVDVDASGVVDADQVIRSLRDDTVICSIMWANNEIGTIQPVAPIASACRERGIPFHSDASQAVGRVPINARQAQVDLLSFSGHKIYGPKGIGVLTASRRRPRIRLQPMFHGGSQQFGVRPGTLAVPLIVGMGLACTLVRAEQKAEAHRVAELRDRLWVHFRDEPNVVQNGDFARRLPGTLNVSFLGVEAQTVLLELPGVAISSGSACAADSHEPSPVLRAIGLSSEHAHAALRFGLGRFNTADEVDEAAIRVLEVVRRLRATSPIHGAARASSQAEGTK